MYVVFYFGKQAEVTVCLYIPVAMSLLVTCHFFYATAE